MRSQKRRLLIATATAAAAVAALAVAPIAQASQTPAKTKAAPSTKISSSLVTNHATTENVIVLLKNQHSSLAQKKGSGASSARARALLSAQSPVVRTARALGATHVTQYSVVNGFAARLSSTKLATLSKRSDVAAIVPDLPIQRPSAAVSDGATTGAAAPTDDTNPTPTTLPYSSYCSSDQSAPTLEPEALQTMHVAYADPNTQSANKLETGAGVTVGWIADGIDINNPDFIRPDGSHVFTDYQDFSGDGLDAPSDAAEAFGDASSIAAQGNQVYNVDKEYASAANPDTAGCYIRVQGVAPGASLVGLKVFGNSNSAPTSHFISAIQYAVTTAGVDVLNESFGGDPFPDNSNDPITLADNAAIAAGVTVVSSTGDSGPNGTIGSPASSPLAIGVAATTNFRSAAQIKVDGFSNEALGIKGWANDNISSLSSGGFAQSGKMPDVAAPGDSSWALCTPDPDMYEGCTGEDKQPSSIEDFGGTSQSSPLTAGTAALVIAAYRKAHHGASPTPALVKSIIVGTAQDLGHPAYEQGAGEVNALAAVQAALSAPATGSTTVPSTAQGASLITATQPNGTDQLNLNGPTNKNVSGTYTVRNASPSTQTVHLTTRSLTTTIANQTGSVSLDPSQTFPNVTGGARAYKIIDVNVPVGADRLQASITANTGPYTVFLALVDPFGVYQAYSSPQGDANFAYVDARYPAPGHWKAMVWANPAFTGAIHYQFTSSKYTSYGSVSPSTVTLAPGHSANIKATFPTGKTPGDTAAAVIMKTQLGTTSTEGVSIRTLIPTSNSVNTFKGNLTGGNGRGSSLASANQYYLNVPKGQKALSLALQLDRNANPNEIFTGYLISPSGVDASVRSNVIVNSDGDLDYGRAIYDYVRAPEAGRWTFVLVLAQPVGGDVINQPFTGTVKFGAAPVTVTGLPSAKTILKHGKTYKYTVTIANNSPEQQLFFADPRRDHLVTYQLASQSPGNDQQNLSLPATEVEPEWLVPTGTQAIDFYANASVPIGLDTFYYFGEPETFSAGSGNSAHVHVAGSPVSNGYWFEDIGEPGPFDGPAPTGTVAANATAKTYQFDETADSSLGDYWFTSLIPAPASDSSSSAAGKHATLGKQSPYFAAAVKQANTTPVKAKASKTKACDPDAPFLETGQSCSFTFTSTPSSSDAGKTIAGHLHVQTLDLFNGNTNDLSSTAYGYRVS